MIFAAFDLMWAFVKSSGSYGRIYNEKYNDDQLGFCVSKENTIYDYLNARLIKFDGVFILHNILKMYNGCDKFSCS